MTTAEPNPSKPQRPDNPVYLDAAVAAVQSGGVIAYPTEAVFGIGCNPADSAAIQRVLALKSRAPDKGLIIIAGDMAQLTPWVAPFDQTTLDCIGDQWPGPVTFIVPARNGVLPHLTGGRDTLAVRVTTHPVVRELCHRCGHALVSTSANRSGGRPLRTAADVLREFEAEIDVIVDAPTGREAKPSRIIDVRSGKRLR